MIRGAHTRSRVIQTRLFIGNSNSLCSSQFLTATLEGVQGIKFKGTTSKLPEVVLEEKRREIIKEWIDSGRIEGV